MLTHAWPVSSINKFQDCNPKYNKHINHFIMPEFHKYKITPEHIRTPLISSFVTLPDLNLTIFPSIRCLVSGRRSEPIIILCIFASLGFGYAYALTSSVKTTKHYYVSFHSKKSRIFFTMTHRISHIKLSNHL